MSLLAAVSALAACVAVGGVSAVLYRFRRQLLRGVPELTASQLGLFRAALGTALVFHVVWVLPTRLTIPSTRDYPWWGEWAWIDALAGSAPTVSAIQVMTLVGLGLFTIGLFTRLALACAATGMTLLVLVVLESGSSHDLSLPLVVLWTLLVVPWGDGLSVDDRLRRARGRPSLARRAGQRYGFGIWLPGFMLGVAFAAAAYAKVAESGIAWATGGAVRYHFVLDSVVAPTSIGLWIANHPLVAVAFATGGLALEALFIAHVLVANPWLRLGFGALGASLLLGINLFQGMFWIEWWILLSALLPWAALHDLMAPALPAGRQRVAAAVRPLADAGTHGITRGFAVLVALVLVAQTVISYLRVETEPFVSDFHMYSNTYASTDDFDERTAGEEKFNRLRFMAGGRDVSQGFHSLDDVDEEFLDSRDGEAPRLVAPSPKALSDLSDRFVDQWNRPPPRRVVVSHTRIRFDWDDGHFVRTRGGRLAVTFPGT